MGNAIAAHEDETRSMALMRQLGQTQGLGLSIATHIVQHGAGETMLSGPSLTEEVPDICIGKWIHQELSSCPPEKIMLVDSTSGREMTASDLLSACSKLALGLERLGVTVSDNVCIIGENTIDLAIAGIATLFIGARMAPVDPLLKSLELQHILGVMEPKLVITDATVVAEVKDALDHIESPASIVTVQPIEGFDYAGWIISSVSDEEGAALVPAEMETHSVAVIVCSSGTTGMPKGVALSHYALAYQVTLFASNWPNGFCLHTSYFYWVSGVLMLIGTSVNKVPRILVKNTDPEAVLSAIDKYKPKFGLMAPALLSTILHHPSVADYDLTSMKALTVGGSALNKSLLDKACEVMSECTLVQGYGASEVAGLATLAKPPTDVLSVGIVIPLCQIKVIDRNTGLSLGADNDGEIVIKSPSMMNEYVGNPDATAQAIDADGWYHTGDIGHYNAEGVLYITGRAKELIKVGGHQISPEEIEAVISGVVGVADVVVTGVDEGDDELPMALVVCQPGVELTEEDITSVIAENLSDFKQLRGGVCFVENFPRTSTGKVKRRDVRILAEELYQERKNQ